MNALELSTVRIYAAQKDVVGTGFFIGDRFIVTCAHVILSALAINKNYIDRPTQNVNLDFPFLAPDRLLAAQITKWYPKESDNSGDIAVLELKGDLPGSAIPAKPLLLEDYYNQTFRTFGFPKGHEKEGLRTAGVVQGNLVSGRLQIEGVTQFGYFIQSGFSGAALWDENLTGVMGMVTAVETISEIRSAFALPTTLIVSYCPEWQVGISEIPVPHYAERPTSKNSGTMTSPISPVVWLWASANDRVFSAELALELTAQGISVLTNKDTEKLEEAFTSAKITHALLVISQAALQSSEVVQALDLAKKHRIRHVVSMLLEECELPRSLCRKKVVDFRERYDAGFEELLRYLSLFVTNIIPDKADLEIVPFQTKRPTPEQTAAAHDINLRIRLIAGPGTGKSFAIEERVAWLLESNVAPASVYVISFTRASCRELHQRIMKYCKAQKIKGVEDVRVTTLHSLALRTLRKAKLLTDYPCDPLVFDEWELEHIFEKEFSIENGLTPTRCEEIRLAYEAFWSTGIWNPPNYVQPKTPISEEEKQSFNLFHKPTTHTYSCVLPGEIVHQCVQNIESGTLDVIELLGIEHLIVDEFQDLNNTDLSFIAAFTDHSVKTYVAGDDDQSVYSFRYAYPAGIQDFTTRYPDAGHHELTKCFRCTPEILAKAHNLISVRSTPNRIRKTLRSQYAEKTSNINGVIHQWKFGHYKTEANAIAASCKILVHKGLNPRDILILVSNKKKDQLASFEDAFNENGLDVELPSGARFVDSEIGRFIFAVVRIVCDVEFVDYVAYRLLLGLPKGIGDATCNGIRKAIIANNQNFLDVFYSTLPSGIFTSRELKAINRARAVCQQLCGWQSDDTLQERSQEILHLLFEAFPSKQPQIEASWKEYTATLPVGMNLREFQAFLGTDNDDQQAAILEQTYERLDMDIPESGLLPARIRIMTMHGVKGLDAKVVFIPWLEDDILPGPFRKPYAGLVLEAARLLYVSITRARAACIMSYATARYMNGEFQTNRSPSPFVKDLGGKFLYRENGLTDLEAEQICQTIDQIQQFDS